MQCHYEQSDLLPSGHHGIVIQHPLFAGQVLVQFEGQEYTRLYVFSAETGMGVG